MMTRWEKYKRDDVFPAEEGVLQMTGYCVGARSTPTLQAGQEPTTKSERKNKILLSNLCTPFSTSLESDHEKKQPRLEPTLHLDNSHTHTDNHIFPEVFFFPFWPPLLINVFDSMRAARYHRV